MRATALRSPRSSKISLSERVYGLPELLRPDEHESEELILLHERHGRPMPARSR